jgi:hypothetical protein
MARGLVVALAVLALVALGGAAHAQSNRCNAAKLKAAGTKAGGKAVCHAKAVAKGAGVDAFCLIKAENKVTSGFAIAESRPPCLTTGDAGAIEDRVDALIDALAGELPDGGPSRCEATKWKAAGNKTKGKLRCHSKAVLRAATVDSTCLLKQDAKFAAAFVKAESGGPCPGSASVVEGIVDAAVDDIAGALGSGTNVCPDCCANTRLGFTTTLGSGVCGAVDPGVCSGTNDPGIPCTTDLDCTGTDVCLGDLACGGLYVGGGAVQATLPSVVPDGTQSITKVVNCSPQTTVFYITATTPAETGSIRTCTAGGVANPDYPACVAGDSHGLPCRSNADCAFPGTCTGTQSGCLFGAPQPIANGSDPASSFCVVNRIDADAAGRATCAGYGFTNLVLGADVYLTGDVDGNAPNGVQPCPVCEAGSCVGGPRNGMACVAAGTDLGAAYPTSHDCPPPPAAFIGTLAVPLTLATGGGSLTAADTDGPAGQANVFCGFCRRPGAPNDFESPPRRCTSNDGCTASPFTLCQQRSPGAFRLGMASYVSAFGRAPDACLTDGMPHAMTLGAAFCVPPSDNPLVDGALDLPGPGAVSLPGTAQLLP